MCAKQSPEHLDASSHLVLTAPGGMCYHLLSSCKDEDTDTDKFSNFLSVTRSDVAELGLRSRGFDSRN